MSPFVQYRGEDSSIREDNPSTEGSVGGLDSYMVRKAHDAVRLELRHGGVSPVASQELAIRLRDLRLERKLSLAGVSEATGLSSSFLSLIENGKSDITFSRLYKLVQFYGVSLLDIAPATNVEPAVVRAGERRHIHSPSEGIDMYLLTPDTDRTMMPVIVVYQPGAEISEAAKHPGEDFVHVIEGRFLIEVEGNEPVILETGDSVYYKATLPHSTKNIGSGISSFFGVMSPPSL